MSMNPELWEISYVEMIIRIAAALLIGGLIGLEREWGDHPAGFRTHILVCLGSALIMLLSIYGFSQFAYEANVRMDPARLAAQVISGIGFLGAGTILRTGMTISGLTTAASLWVVAALGLAVGAGFYFGAGVTAVLVFISLFLLNKLEQTMTRRRNHCEVIVEMKETAGSLKGVMDIMEEYGATVINMTVDSEPREEEEALMVLSLKLRLSKMKRLSFLVEDLRLLKGVKSVEYLNWNNKGTVKDKNESQFKSSLGV